MSESYSVKAVLSAEDKNMSSTFQKAIGTAETFKNRVTSIVAGMGVTKALASATNLLTSSLDGAITRYDTLHSYPKVMNSLGFSTDAAKASVSKLNASIQGLPTSLSDIVKSAQSLTSVTGNMDKATDTAIALNHALLASSASTEDCSRAQQQYSQMLAVGKVDMMAWRTLQETMAPALSKVAKKLGITTGNTTELYNAVKEGRMSFDQLNQALIECDTEAGGFADTALAASKTIRTGFTNIKSAVQNLEMSIIGAVNNILDSQGMGGIVDILDKIKTSIYNVRNAFMESSDGIDYVFKPEVLEKITYVLERLKATITGTWNTFKSTGAIEHAQQAILSVKDAILHVVDAVDKAHVIQDLAGYFGGLISKISLVVQHIADFIKSLKPETIQFFAKAITKLFEAYATYKVVQLATNKIKVFGSAVSDTIGNVKSLAKATKSAFDKLKEGDFKGIFSKKPKQSDLPGTSDVVEQTSKSALMVERVLDGLAKNIQAIGKSIKSVFDGLGNAINSVGTSIASAAEGIGTGIKTALSGVGEVIKSFGTAISTVAQGIGTGLATAFRGLGSAIAMVPPTTWLALSVAILAVGAAMALVASQGEGMNLILQGVGSVILSLQPIVATVVVGIVAVVGQLPTIFESVGTAIKTALQGVADVISSLGNSISQVVTSISTGMSTIVTSIGNAISGVLNALSGIIDSIGNAALNAGRGFNQLATGITKITNLNLFDMGASLTAVATGLGAISLASGGVANASAGLQKLVSALSSISGATASAGASFNLMASVATSSTNRMISSMTGAVGKAKAAGQNIGNGISNGVKSGMNKLPSTVNSALNSMYSALNSAQSRAYNSGYMIGIGLANGLNASSGAVRAAAASLASAADAAIRAKARIHSPSRVSTKDGEYWGQGWVNGILNKVKDVRSAMNELLYMPTLYTPNLSLNMAGSFGGSLNEDYSYYRNANYTIVVKSEIDGKEVARSTAEYTEEELEKREKFKDLLGGKR